jgi:NAD+ diphosphatase
MTASPPIVPAAPNLRLEPRLAYAGSGIERAAFRRDDAGALAALTGYQRAGFYVVAGEIVMLKKPGEEADPLFSLAEARALGEARETVFLGLLGEAPRFGIGLDPAAVDPLKGRNDLKLVDLRTIAVQAVVAAEHLAPLAEAKALLGWHARHRFCPNCAAPGGPAPNLPQSGSVAIPDPAQTLGGSAGGCRNDFNDLHVSLSIMVKFQ